MQSVIILLGQELTSISCHVSEMRINPNAQPHFNLQAAASAADLQKSRNIHINLWFLGSKEHFDLVRIALAWKLPQELRQIVKYRPQTVSQTFEKLL